MNKRVEREHKFKLLYSTLFYPREEQLGQVENYLRELPTDEAEPEPGAAELSEAEMEVLRGQLAKIVDKVEELDTAIDAVAEGWKTRRMGKVELSILRLALYEIRYADEVPDKVAINEAVELAKKYGGADSRAFVNGILAKLV